MSDRLTFDALTALRAQGVLRDIDYHLAQTLYCREATGEAAAWPALTAAIASYAVTEGHICLDLAELAGTSWPAPRADAAGVFDAAAHTVTLPALDDWIDALTTSSLCGTPDDEGRPLTLVTGERPRVYLRRYYLYEQRIAIRLHTLAARVQSDTAATPKTDALIDVLFPPAPHGAHDAARAAATAALTRRLVIISGGPGTGKTHALARLLVLLVSADTERGNDIAVIRMAAPTGKAAQRMRASIRAAKESLALDDDLLRHIPEDAATLHRLLGTRPNSPHFRHNADNPLPADIVIVDEASMIDLPLMAKLLDALHAGARLILLGDMHQLSSVEPGYVLGDICQAARADAESPLAGSLIAFTHSWRFPAGGRVGRLAAALQSGSDDAWEVLQALQDEPPASDDAVVWRSTPEDLRDRHHRPDAELCRLVCENYGPFVETTDVAAAFDALARFRVLCALRHGPHGVANLNRAVEEILFASSAAAGAPRRQGGHYDHQVVMVTRNDYGLRLFNGDIGIILPASAAGASTGDDDPLVAWFETTDEATGERRFRALPCHMLPAHETAFAMTIHKSQGSQFRNVLVVLPVRENRLLSRELVYTAITRAEKRVWLWCGEAAFRQAATSTTARHSGLTDALCGKETCELLAKPLKQG